MGASLIRLGNLVSGLRIIESDELGPPSPRSAPYPRRNIRSSLLPAAVIVAPTPLVATVFAAMMTPAVIAAVFTPDATTLLANFGTSMLIAPRLVVLGPVTSPNLCFRLRSPSY
jgi:hypothetical protein